jgi:hypothetical protein
MSEDKRDLPENLTEHDVHLYSFNETQAISTDGIALEQKFL